MTHEDGGDFAIPDPTHGLIQAAMRGDGEVFWKLYDEYRPVLWECARQSAPALDPDELVHSTFIMFWKGIRAGNARVSNITTRSDLDRCLKHCLVRFARGAYLRFERGRGLKGCSRKRRDADTNEPLPGFEPLREDEEDHRASTPEENAGTLVREMLVHARERNGGVKQLEDLNIALFVCHYFGEEETCKALLKEVRLSSNATRKRIKRVLSWLQKHARFTPELCDLLERLVWRPD